MSVRIFQGIPCQARDDGLLKQPKKWYKAVSKTRQPYTKGLFIALQLLQCGFRFGEYKLRTGTLTC